MSECFDNSESLVNLLIGDRPLFVSGEGEVTRVSICFTFPPITLKNLVMVTAFERDDLYCDKPASLYGHL